MCVCAHRLKEEWIRELAKNNIRTKQLNQTYITQIQSLEQVCILCTMQTQQTYSVGGSNGTTRAAEGTDFTTETAEETVGKQQCPRTDTVSSDGL